MKKLEIIAIVILILAFILLVLSMITGEVFFAFSTIALGVIGLVMLMWSVNREEEKRDEEEGSEKLRKVRGIIEGTEDSYFCIFTVSYTYKESILRCELCYYRSCRDSGWDLEYDGGKGGRGRGRVKKN